MEMFFHLLEVSFPLSSWSKLPCESSEKYPSSDNQPKRGNFDCSEVCLSYCPDMLSSAPLVPH